MVRITVDLLRKRAEHNDGVLYTLEEIGLHHQNIEKIELLGHLCRNLRTLHLQGNLIGKLENLHRLKELRHLNVALNNITRIENVQRCESLERLDLTANFIAKSALTSVACLQHSIHFRELHLLGNPCAEWDGYRDYVIAALPQLQKLDGTPISTEERGHAEAVLPQLQSRRRSAVLADGGTPDACSEAEDDSLLEAETIPETGYMGEDGEMRRPWCPATRVLEHREAQRVQAEAERRRSTAMQQALRGAGHRQPRTDFPPLQEGERPLQRNEGGWDFTLGESSDGQAIELEVAIGRYLDSSLVKADIQPKLARLLIKGLLLQLQLPQEVKPDRSSARRAATTGRLLLRMPKEDPGDRHMDLACCRPRAPGEAALQVANGCSKAVRLQRHSPGDGEGAAGFGGCTGAAKLYVLQPTAERDASWTEDIPPL